MFIYCIENIINNKCYIGQTYTTFGIRKSQHIYSLNTKTHSNPYLQNAFNKYGENNFRFFILEDGFKTIKELNEAEEFWIDYLQTLNDKSGYNLDSGGNNYKRHEKTKLKISKPILQYSLSGELIDIYESITKAAKEMDGTINNLVTALKGVTNTAYDYQWKYYTGELKERIKPVKSKSEIKYNKGESKVTEQYDLQGNFIKDFPSASEASRVLGINAAGIRACCKGRYITSGKYQWKFKDSDKNIKDLKDHKPKDNTPKGVIKLNDVGFVTGEWDSLNKASKDNKFSRFYISQKCKDNSDHIWNYKEF